MVISKLELNPGSDGLCDGVRAGGGGWCGGRGGVGGGLVVVVKRWMGWGWGGENRKQITKNEKTQRH